MIYQYESARHFLQNHFDEKVRRNPRYSLRSYALHLNVSPAELSQVFAGKRNLSSSSAQKIIKSLSLNMEEAKHFLWTLQADKGKTPDLFPQNSKDAKANFSLQDFAEICEWYHFAILSLIDTKDFQWSSAFVAKKLNLSISEAGLAMRDLQKAGLLKIEKKSARSTKSVVRVGGAIPFEAVRRYHRQMIQKSLEALDTVHTDLREYQSIGLALNENDFKKMKGEIDEFTDRLMAKYHRPSSNQVYQIQICAFPLTKGSKT